MQEELVVLEGIRQELAKLDGEVVGPVALDRENACLDLPELALTLAATVFGDDSSSSVAHVHVAAGVDGWHEPLEGCVLGIDDSREEALRKAGTTWANMVAHPILSLLRAIQIGKADHFSGLECWGVRDSHGFVGPAGIRSADPSGIDLEAVSVLPLFDGVPQLTPAGHLHIAKATLGPNGRGGRQRCIEIDGHGVCHKDHDWEIGIPLPGCDQAIVTRFAIYHAADQAGNLAKQQELDEAIRRYLDVLQADSELDPTDTEEQLCACGVSAEHAYWLGHLAPLAFGRVLLFDLDAQFASVYRTVLVGGELSDPEWLVSNPLYARCVVAGWRCRATESLHGVFRRLGLASAECSVINDMLNKGSKAEDLRLFAPLLPDRGLATDDYEHGLEMHFALELSKEPPRSERKRPWWKFW